jgi:hypothetical protein
VTRARILPASGHWAIGGLSTRSSRAMRRRELRAGFSVADFPARVHALHRGSLVLVAAAALMVLSACGTTTGLRHTPTSAAGQPGVNQPALRIRRVVPPGLQHNGFETLVKTTTDPTILTEVRSELAALPLLVASGSSPCGSASCLLNCPIDFGIIYELTITDAHGAVEAQATLDAQGCRIASVSPGEGGRRLDDESSPLWTLVSTVLGVQRCTVIQPPVEGWKACKWPSSQTVHATASPSP